jgi:glycerol-1-phosphate dehydrogenase [NAD(P)+]
MICAGSSRPASGAEHEISHAIDQHLGGRALHGAQVAFGCVFSVALYGEDPAAFRERLARLGLPQHPGELGLSEDDAVDLLLAAPGTRPGRFTILEDADLDDAKARALVRSVWGRP